MSNRKAYQEKVEAQLKEWNAELERLRAKALKADADARIELGRTVDTLQQHFRDTQDAFVGLIAAGEDAWTAAQQRVEDARTTLLDAITEARSAFRGEVAGSAR